MSKEGFVGCVRHACWFIVGCCVGLIGVPLTSKKEYTLFDKLMPEKEPVTQRQEVGIAFSRFCACRLGVWVFRGLGGGLAGSWAWVFGALGLTFRIRGVGFKMQICRLRLGFGASHPRLPEKQCL